MVITVVEEALEEVLELGEAMKVLFCVGCADYRQHAAIARVVWDRVPRGYIEVHIIAGSVLGRLPEYPAYIGDYAVVCKQCGRVTLSDEMEEDLMRR